MRSYAPAYPSPTIRWRSEFRAHEQRRFLRFPWAVSTRTLLLLPQPSNWVLSPYAGKPVPKPSLGSGEYQLHHLSIRVSACAIKAQWAFTPYRKRKILGFSRNGLQVPARQPNRPPDTRSMQHIHMRACVGWYSRSLETSEKHQTVRMGRKRASGAEYSMKRGMTIWRTTKTLGE